MFASILILQDVLRSATFAHVCTAWTSVSGPRGALFAPPLRWSTRSHGIALLTVELVIRSSKAAAAEAEYVLKKTENRILLTVLEIASNRSFVKRYCD